jgi:sugar-specific transcriptional regulator TrmB
MNTSRNQLDEFLKLLGLTAEEKSVYSALVVGSDLSVLQVAQNSGVNRTSAYRILERLKKIGLAEELVDENRIKFRKTGTDKLELLVKQEQEKVRQLNKMLPDISSIINQVSQTAQPGTKVLFYRGRDGIRQMGWNVLKARRFAVGFTFHPYEEIVGSDFLEEWKKEWLVKKMVFRDIYSDEYKRSQSPKRVLYDIKYFESRYIPDKLLHINHQMDIHDDVIGIYNWHEGEIIGVEIYNAKVAAFHKQIFEIIWGISKPENSFKNRK